LKNPWAGEEDGFFGSSAKRLEQLHPQLMHWWLLVHSSPFLQVHKVAALFTSHSNLHNYAEPNQQHMLDFLHPILLCKIAYQAPVEMFLDMI
jgi:hypothetical protein